MQTYLKHYFIGVTVKIETFVGVGGIIYYSFNERSNLNVGKYIKNSDYLAFSKSLFSFVLNNCLQKSLHTFRKLLIKSLII